MLYPPYPIMPPKRGRWRGREEEKVEDGRLLPLCAPQIQNLENVKFAFCNLVLLPVLSHLVSRCPLAKLLLLHL